MAGVVSVTPAEVLLSRRVQDLAISGEELPAPYISRHQDEEVDEPTESFVPIIDLGIASASTSSVSAQEHEEELQKLKSALESWGCFQAIGHGIPGCLLDNMLEVAREFFSQPMEEKKKYSKEVMDFEGYGADPVPEEGQSLDWSDRLFLEVFPEDQRNLKFWPQNPRSFRDVLGEYSEKMKRVIELASKAMAKSLNLEENCFLEQFGERSMLQARFNYYSRCQRPDLILGLKAHADGTGYTIILQDEIGLQVFIDGKWQTVPRVHHALLILMGDQMQIMTNRVFTSPVHRVLTSSERDRLSLAMFYTPEKGKEIEPEQGLISEARPAVFKKVKDYADTHWIYYQQGRRALHTAMV